MDASAPATSNQSVCILPLGRPLLSIIHALIQVFAAVFRSAALTLLQFVSILMGAMGAAALVGFFVLSGAGVLGVRYARRNKPRN